MNTPNRFADLSPFFSPKGVAVVGAAEDPIRLGGRPVDYMLRYGFAGGIYPVHPKHQTIQGLKAYPSLSDIEGEVETAVIAVSAKLAEGVIEEGLSIGLKGFIVFSSGYAEMGDEGRAAQERLAAMCTEAGAVLLGPNCLGCADSHSRLSASFSTAMDTSSFSKGSFSLITQSGALGSYWMAMVDRQNLGFSKFMATGNEAGVTVADGIAWLADDDTTDVIGIYVEDIKDGDAFRRAALKAAACDKPVLAIKSGRSTVGAEAAASHTGALAGEDANYQSFFDQFGIVRVNSLSEMIDTAKLLSMQPKPRGRRVAVATVSGGAGVMLADELDERGFSIPDFSEATKSNLNKILPPFIAARNPLDYTGGVAGDPEFFDRIIKVLSEANDHDAYILFNGLMESIAPQLVGTLKRAFENSDKQIGVVWLGASDFVVSELEGAGIPVFADIPQAALAFERASQSAQGRDRANARQSIVHPPVTLVSTNRDVLPEVKATELVKSLCSIEFPQSRLVSEGVDVAAALGDLKFPLAAKLQSADMPHKSEHGGVVLGITKAEDAVAAVDNMMSIAERMGIRFEGVLLQEMIPFAHELIIGLRNDALFGPQLLIGRGGVEVELRPDTCSAYLPLSADEIKTMLDSLETSDLLNGHRGGPAADLDSLASSLAALGDGFLASPELVELEINPLVLTTDGRMLALDALAIVDSQAASRP